MSLPLTAVKGPAELQSCHGNSRTCGADVGRCTGPKSEGRLFTTVNTGSCQNTLRTAAVPRLERGPVPPLSMLPSFPSSTNGIRPQRRLPRRHLSPGRHIAQSFFNLRPIPAGNLPRTHQYPWNHSTVAQAAPPAAASPCRDWREHLTDSSRFFSSCGSERCILPARGCLHSALQHLLHSIQPPLRSASHSESPFQVRYK